MASHRLSALPEPASRWWVATDVASFARQLCSEPHCWCADMLVDEMQWPASLAAKRFFLAAFYLWQSAESTLKILFKFGIGRGLNKILFRAAKKDTMLSHPPCGVVVQGVVLLLWRLELRQMVGPLPVLRPGSMRAQDSPLKPCEFGGTTALVALRIGEVLYVAHAGDSRAVLASDGKALRLTADHKPDRPDECARVWVRPRVILFAHAVRACAQNTLFFEGLPPGSRMRLETACTRPHVTRGVRRVVSCAQEIYW